ncbi:MAG: hypothetical protein OXF27_01435, partial [Acidobacteria bacterium]|nr:hypothetical protein [Acidobacteriota bacterium]
ARLLALRGVRRAQPVPAVSGRARPELAASDLERVRRRVRPVLAGPVLPAPRAHQVRRRVQPDRHRPRTHWDPPAAASRRP